jgi:hypothetical protein
MTDNTEQQPPEDALDVVPSYQSIKLVKASGTTITEYRPNYPGTSLEEQQAVGAEDVAQKLQQELKTAYELARAATGTEEGREAIDFFYHVHLNSWPGLGAQLISRHYIAKEAVANKVNQLSVLLYDTNPYNGNELEWVRVDQLKQALNLDSGTEAKK